MLPSVSINKILFEHSHIHSFTYCLQSLNYLPSDPLQKSLSTFDLNDELLGKN